MVCALYGSGFCVFCVVLGFVDGALMFFFFFLVGVSSLLGGVGLSLLKVWFGLNWSHFVIRRSSVVVLMLLV